MNSLEEYRRRKRASVMRALLKAHASDGRKPIRIHISKLLRPRKCTYQELRSRYPGAVFGFDTKVIDKFFKKLRRSQYYPFRDKAW